MLDYKNGLLKFLALLVLVGLISCSDKENMEFADWPIIESYLYIDQPFIVKVSRQIPFLSDVEYSEDDIDKLNIQITFEDSVYFLESIGDGVYADSSLPLEENATYYMAMTFNSKDVMAYTTIPEKPTGYSQSVTSISVQRMDSTGTPSAGGGSMPDPVEITWDNEDESYYLLVIENIEETLDPIRDFGDEDPPENIFRKSPTTATSEQIRPMDFEYFGTHMLILYHVLPDYAALYDQSNNSSQNLSNPSTSITNGYGIFTGLNSDTLYLEVKEAK